MGITDPNQLYFKNGLWGFDGSVWRSLSLLFGYQDVVRDQTLVASAAAGFNVLDSAAVPSGEIWIVTGIGAMDSTSSPAYVSLMLHSGLTDYRFKTQLTPAVSEVVSASGWFPLKAGENVRATMGGVTAGDSIRLDVIGFSMPVS